MKFEAKIKRNHITEEGKEVTLKEDYLLSAETYGDAEQQIYKQAETYSYQRFKLESLKISNIEKAKEGGDIYFRAKASLEIEDEMSGKFKKVPMYVLVNAKNMKEATREVEEFVKESVPYDFTIASITETKIIDIWS